MNWIDSVRGDHIVIAGAASGAAVAHWGRYWSAAQFHLFEPSEAWMPRLLKVVSDTKHRVIFSKAALLDAPGEVMLYDHPTLPQVASVFDFDRGHPQCQPSWAATQARPVQAITLDGYCQQRGIEHIGFIELDVQGAELRALHGASGLLANKTIDALMVEVFYSGLYQGIPLAGEVREYLGQFGYTSIYTQRIKNACWGDELFVGGAK